MTEFQANLPRRMLSGVLWSAGLFLVTVGRRLYFAHNNPDYSVPVWLIAFGLALPLVLLILPRLLTPNVVRIADDEVTFSYLFAKKPRTIERSRLSVGKKGGTAMTLVEWIGHKEVTGPTVLSAGFTKGEWQEMASLLHTRTKDTE